MRRRLIFLLPALLVLAILGWGSSAAAHPCHEASETHETGYRPAPILNSQVAVSAETSMSGSESPSGCCGQAANCMAQCAAAVTLPATFDMVLAAGRGVFESTAIAAMTGAPPRTANDPPRLRA